MEFNTILLIVYILLVVVFFSLNYYEKFSSSQLLDVTLNYKEVVLNPDYKFPDLRQKEID